MTYVMVIHQFADVFAHDDQDLGHTHWVKHAIGTGDADPIRSRANRAPITLRKALEEMIETMESQGDGITIVLVPKSDGGVRFCVDYRRLNKVTRVDAYPLPRLNELLDGLCGYTLFSTLDLQSGYWQIEYGTLGCMSSKSSRLVLCQHRRLFSV